MKPLIYVICCILVTALPLYSQEEAPSADTWYSHFFVEAAGQYYAVPGLLSGLIDPNLGFRAALGYELRRLRFALESGYTFIDGTNPVALEFRFSPLLFKFGYSQPVYGAFGLQADLGLGRLFSRTLYYENAIAVIRDDAQDARNSSFLAALKLYGTWTFNRAPLKLYLGGGFDLLRETDGFIPLPLIEAGLSFKPLAMIKPRAARLPHEGPNVVSAPVEIDPEELVFAHSPENLVLEHIEGVRTYRLLNAVYFEANSANMIKRFRPILDEAGARLRADPGRTIILRAYAAPFGTEDGLVALSAARAWHCMDYLMTEFGIAQERMRIEYFGAERVPEWANASWESYRCVELIINEESSRQDAETPR